MPGAEQADDDAHGVGGEDPQAVAQESAPGRFEILQTVQTRAGAATLYQRIHQAAKQVCEQTGADRNLQARQMQESCIARAESRAVDNVHSNALSAYYQMTHGSSYPVTAANDVR